MDKPIAASLTLTRPRRIDLQVQAGTGRPALVLTQRTAPGITLQRLPGEPLLLATIYRGMRGPPGLVQVDAADVVTTPQAEDDFNQS